MSEQIEMPTIDWVMTVEQQSREIISLRAEGDAIRKLLPDWCVLDPPDGGDVKTIEAVQRLVAEIERLQRENTNLRVYITALHNNINTENSPYIIALKTLEDIILSIKHQTHTALENRYDRT